MTTCKQCQQQFEITDADRAFYAKMQVPHPTFCPMCRMIRRMAIRNEHALYARTCQLCNKSIISMYAPDAPFVVYCVDCWNSDAWDAMVYGRDYNFDKPFFEQFAEFLKTVPRISLYQHINEKSDFTNYSVYLKNSYMVFGGHHYEDCLYCAQSIFLKDCIDVEFCKNSERCSHSLHLNKCYNTHYSILSENCTDSWFLNDCRNCSNCVGCAGLRNKSYCIFNEQYTKESYAEKIKELHLGSQASLREIEQRAAAVALTLPKKYAIVKNIEDSSGDDLENVKNCRYCFSATGDEDCAYSFFLPGGAKDVYDGDHVGLGVELALEIMSGFENNRVAYGNRIYNNHDVYYSDDCHGCSYLFGCASLRKKNYCIFNKQYTKEEYEALMPKIRAHMDAMPFKGPNGREYGYGEFFPVEISAFAYNETMAHDYFPLTKEEALVAGYRWRDPAEKHPAITMDADELPATAADAPDDVTRALIGCAHAGACNHQCTKAFKIVAQELAMYKVNGLPLPQLCPNCRHYERLAKKNPLQLWHRQCACSLKGHGHHADHTQCANQFETTYAPERPEKVYCEQCYQQEVV